METLKKHWPLFACTAVLVITIVACTAVVMDALGDSLFDLYEIKHMLYKALPH
jgi:hypothetical protein